MSSRTSNRGPWLSAGVGIDDEVQEDNRTSAVDEFAISEDEMDDFIDDDDGNGTRGRGRVRTKGAPQGVSNDGIQVRPSSHKPR